MTTDTTAPELVDIQITETNYDVSGIPVPDPNYGSSVRD